MFTQSNILCKIYDEKNAMTKKIYVEISLFIYKI